MVSGVLLTCIIMHNVNVLFDICAAFARFSEAILDYLADDQRASSGQIHSSQFEGHISSAFDQLFNVWLPSKESRVSYMYVISVEC